MYNSLDIFKKYQGYTFSNSSIHQGVFSGSKDRIIWYLYMIINKIFTSVEERVIFVGSHPIILS